MQVAYFWLHPKKWWFQGTFLSTCKCYFRQRSPTSCHILYSKNLSRKPQMTFFYSLIVFFFQLKTFWYNLTCGVIHLSFKYLLPLLKGLKNRHDQNRANHYVPFSRKRLIWSSSQQLTWKIVVWPTLVGCSKRQKQTKILNNTQHWLFQKKITDQKHF